MNTQKTRAVIWLPLVFACTRGVMSMAAGSKALQLHIRVQICVQFLASIVSFAKLRELGSGRLGLLS